MIARGLAAAALALAALIDLVVLLALPAYSALALATAPLVLGVLGYGLWQGGWGSTAFGVGGLGVVVATALGVGDPDAATIVVLSALTWFVALAATASLLVRVDEIAPEVAGSLVRWAAGITVAGLGVTTVVAMAAGRGPDRTVAAEALAAVAAVAVVVGIAGLAGTRAARPAGS